MFFSILREAVSSILSNKSRTILTLLGVVIGIASVVTVVAAGEGGKSIIMKEFEGFSPTSIQIYANWNEYHLDRTFKVEPMNDRDLADLEKFAPHLEAVTPLVNRRSVIRVGGIEKNLNITGTNQNYIDYVEYQLTSGRIITQEEVRNQAKVAVIGSLIKEEFFPWEDPVGQYMTIFGTPIRIVGVLAEKEKTDMISISNPDETYNNAIVVPISLFDRLFNQEGEYWFILAKATSIEDIPQAKKEALRVLARNHGKWNDRVDKFQAVEMQSQIEMINTVIGAITIGVSVLAGIALLVAAIGIMNIMLVSVKERTREIGIRKAIGAKKQHIMLQFLLETLLICGGGGLLGLALAFGAAGIIGHFAKWPVIFQGYTIVLSLSLSIITGLVSGLYPAGRAADLVPQEALRYE